MFKNKNFQLGLSSQITSTVHIDMDVIRQRVTMSVVYKVLI